MTTAATDAGPAGDGTARRVRADAATAFLLGNGPSLKSVDLRRLSPFATVGMNAAYRYWREIDWRPRYYACLDTVVGLSHADAIAELIRESRIQRFLLRSNLIEALGHAAATPTVVNYDAIAARRDIYRGATITTGSGAALWAADMGYRRLVMLGVDATYTEVVDGARKRSGIELEIMERRENPNYFFEGYQAPGDRYNLPNPRPDLHVGAWTEAGVRLAARADVEVYNANAASAVRVFPFVDLDALLGAGATPAPAPQSLPSPFTRDLPQRAAAPASPQAKLAQLIRRSWPALTFFAGLSALAVVLVASAATPAALTLGIALAVALLNALAALVLHTRGAVAAVVNDQSAELAALRARIADLERMAGAPSDDGR
ncbi:MAG: hypothetical protein GC152_06805 [Alphaproteobacteria bacterium]|nr:hypothetical protein [Alphaproteobacteria bacterium]